MQSIPNYDATFCGKLPIHQTNSIQPHGVLLFTDKELSGILQASENFRELLNVDDFTGTSLVDYISKDSLDRLQTEVRSNTEKFPIRLIFNHAGVLTCFVHQVDNGVIVEVELPHYYTETGKSFLDVYVDIKQVMQQIGSATSLEEVADITAICIKKLTGFDKVMVYRFDEKWNGYVLSEQSADGMELYEGLTFPASDIPKPARDMYLKNPYRVIPDRNYAPVKLTPLLNPLSGGFTNLINADLRSVASVHLEYLKNMKVTASMSCRILADNKLWGLIACHHRTAKFMSFEQCSVMEMVSNIVSEKITALQTSEASRLQQELLTDFTHLAEKIIESENFHTVFLQIANNLKHFLKADSIALSWNGAIETFGETPSTSEISTLVYWLRQKVTQHAYHENKLPEIFEESKRYADVASGIIALPIQAEKGNYIIAFRNELINTVEWGGNPNHALQFETDSTIYHPRHSFDVWKQTVRNTSEKWHEEEVRAAEMLRNFLVQQTLNRLN